MEKLEKAVPEKTNYLNRTATLTLSRVPRRCADGVEVVPGPGPPSIGSGTDTGNKLDIAEHTKI